MRVFRLRMSTLVLMGLLLVTVVSRVNCESSVVDDEDDDDEPVDEMETSGSAVGVHSDNSASADTFERPPNVNTYRDDQSSRNSNNNNNNNEAHQQQHPPAHNSYETTAAESNQSGGGGGGNQIYADSEDVETDSETFDDNMDSNEFGENDDRDGDGDSSSSQSQSQPAQPSAPLNGQQQSPTLFTYQNNRSKLLNIIKKPGILAGIVGGAIIGILTAILLIMFIVYRMRKKDEGSYALEETKKPLNAYDYRHCPTKEFYA